jgi:hypothetical protein
MWVSSEKNGGWSLTQKFTPTILWNQASRQENFAAQRAMASGGQFDDYDAPSQRFSLDNDYEGGEFGEDGEFYALGQKASDP